MFDTTKVLDPARLCRWGLIASVLFASAPVISDPGSDFARETRSPIPVVAEVPHLEAGCLSAPVKGEIIATFSAPDCPYCAGRRTLRFAAAVNDEVVAPATGRITFVGSVAGIGYVTIQPTRAPFHLVTVGGLVIGQLDPAGMVVRDEIIGTAEAANGIHLSVRQVHSAGPPTYRDPEPMLARWRVQARLVPLDGSAPRPSPARHGCSAEL